MARHQVFFAGRGAHSALLALIVQRVRGPDGIELEAKAVLAWDGAWRTPFWERVPLQRWPGTSLEGALGAWEAAHRGRPLRLEVERGAGLSIGLRTPEGGLELEIPTLLDAGSGSGPHGALTWRSGAASLEVNGARVRGTAVVEELSGGDPSPDFDGFELWWLAEAEGMRLGRVHGGSGTALRVGGGVEPLSVVAGERVVDAPSGHALPRTWIVDGRAYRWVGGELGRGEGGAVSDLGVAVAEGGEALVFHLDGG